MTMTAERGISGYKVIGLIVSMLFALLPFYEQLAWWMAIAATLLGLWGAGISSGRLANPSRWLKMLTVAACLGLLLISTTNWYSLQAFVSLLALTACLKFIELQGRRDYLLLVFLGCFISAGQLLFSTSLLAFAYVLLCLFLFHCCLFQLFNHASSRWQFARKQLTTVSKLLLQAVPLALVLFLVIPRLGSLWQIPLNSQIAKTGVSDSLSIGDISQLNKDDSVAMRVTFTSKSQPAVADLYWRGVTLADFDGKTWRRSQSALNALDSEKAQSVSSNKVSLSGAPQSATSYSYQVMLEPSGQNWLYSLATPAVQNSNQIQWSDYSVSAKSIVATRLEYSLTSHPNYRDRSPLAEREFNYFTSLTGNENPRARALAKQLKEENPQPQQYIEAIMTYFNERFLYTLSPGALVDENTVDNFLFDSQRGYCEHFASSTAFLLRAAGIPARIAAGYQGGELSSDRQYMLVTQAQAHAWVEVWLEGSGWVRIDPTNAVAPERIEQGIDSLLPQLVEQGSLGFLVRQNSLIKQLNLQWDSVNYQWHRWVLGYDNQMQVSVVMRLLGGLESWRILLLLLLALVVAVSPLVLKALWVPKEQDKILRVLKKLDKKLARLGLERATGETLSQFLKRAAKSSQSNSALLLSIEKTCVSLIYQREVKDADQRLRHLSKLINKLSL